MAKKRKLDLISGIHNYCDRWCERCPFTQRCAVGVEEAKRFGDRDLQNEEFWKDLQAIFHKTGEMLREMAEEIGLDLDAVDPQEVEAEMQEHRRKQKEARRHPVATKSLAYMNWVDRWFKKHDGDFKAKGEELMSQAQMELPAATPVEDAEAIDDACSVIRWYQMFIHIKFLAISGKDNEDLLDENGKAFPRDCDGSAKIALIAIDRSIAAWAMLRNHFPDEADNLLDALVGLERLRRLGESTFPNARAFQRPGFDYMPAEE